MLTWVFTARSFGYLVGSLIGGVLLDYLPTRGNLLMSLSLALSGFGTVIIPYINSIWVLMVTTSIQGVANGVQDSVVNALLIFLHGADVGPWMQALYFSFGFGCLIAPLLVRFAMAEDQYFAALELEIERDLDVPESMQGSGSSYALSFWLFFLFSMIPAIQLQFWESPVQQNKETKNEPSSGGGNKLIRCGLPIAVISISSLVLALASGAEVSYGSFVLVYSKWNLNFSEANG